jgi:hypothetical protein
MEQYIKLCLNKYMGESLCSQREVSPWDRGIDTGRGQSVFALVLPTSGTIRIDIDLMKTFLFMESKLLESNIYS